MRDRVKEFNREMEAERTREREKARKRESEQEGAAAHQPEVVNCNEFDEFLNPAEFVASRRLSGVRKWVLHAGRAIDLEDASHTRGMSEAVFEQLLQQALVDDFCDAVPRGPAIPLQPWEAEKLQNLAAQTVSALHEGRYTRDFGEILMQHLKGWSGAEAWAQAECEQMHALVAADDEASRKVLLQELERGVLSTLREIKKEEHRGRLAGVVEPELRASGYSGDAEYESQLRLAIEASIQEQWEFLPAAEGHRVHRVQPQLAEGHRVQPRSLRATECSHSSRSCGHACDLAGGCCICVHRRPRPGLLDGLARPWFGPRGLLDGLSSLHTCRFICGTCAGRASRGPETLPLPFGGVLTFEGDTPASTKWEFVQLCSDCGGDPDSWSQAALSSEDGSWEITEVVPRLEL